MPIGGVVAKINAAKEAGAKKVLIPKENWQKIFEDDMGITVIPVERIEEVIRLAVFKPILEVIPITMGGEPVISA